MDRRNKVLYLLHLVSEEVENILTSEENGIDQLSAEQILMVAAQVVTTEQFALPEFTSPLGTINPDEVMFEMSDGSYVNIRGVEHGDEDEVY